VSRPSEYPWAKLRRGQGFFVPALDLQATQLEGLRLARQAGYNSAKAEQVLVDGFIGVWFYLDPSASVHKRVRQYAAHRASRASAPE